MRRIVSLAVAGCLTVLVVMLNAGASQATAPSGSGATFTYRATVDPYHFDSNDYKVLQKNPQDVVMRQITIAAGGDTGWHFHPGPTFVLVVQGTLSNYQAN